MRIHRYWGSRRAIHCCPVMQCAMYESQMDNNEPLQWACAMAMSPHTREHAHMMKKHPYGHWCYVYYSNRCCSWRCCTVWWRIRWICIRSGQIFCIIHTKTTMCIVQYSSLISIKQNTLGRNWHMTTDPNSCKSSVTMMITNRPLSPTTFLSGTVTSQPFR